MIKSKNFVLNVPDGCVMYQNYPNPFNPTTTIQFGLPQKSEVSLRIYDITGKLVKILVNEKKDAGYHSIIWNGMDDAGREVASGVYFYKIKSEDFKQTRKCLMLK